MSYSTRAEVRDMVKDDALNAIIGDTFIEDPAEREELVSPIIDAAIADADAEIDGYLAKRYAVPLAPAPRVINKFSKDIAVYNLFSRIGIDEGTDQKTYLNRYNAAIKFLTLVAEGTVSIGTETEDPASAAAAPSAPVSLRKPRRVVARDPFSIESSYDVGRLMSDVVQI